MCKHTHTHTYTHTHTHTHTLNIYIHTTHINNGQDALKSVLNDNADSHYNTNTDLHTNR